MKIERVYHTWDKWECYRAGFYATKPPHGMTADDAEQKYAELLADENEFKAVCFKIINEWVNSCEHYLTNENMNRIAWMGQAALAYKYRIPHHYRGGYHLLPEQAQKRADEIALEAINAWLAKGGFETHTLETIKSRTEANLY